MLPPVLVPHPHVRVDADVLGGSPFVAGSRVPVRRLWAWHHSGISVETLLKRYPQLGPARILDALAFAYDNQDLIDTDLAHERSLLTEPRYAPNASPTQQALPLQQAPSAPAFSRPSRL